MFANTGELFIYSNGFYAMSPASTMQLNQWQHVAVCRSSGTTRTFRNGVQVGTGTFNTNATNTLLSVGSYVGDSTQPFVGYIDELRISDVARYTSSSSFTPPQLSGTTTTTTVGTPTLPTAVGNTNLYTLKNITSTFIAIGTTNSQNIDGQALDAGDSLWADVVASLHGNGTNASTTIVDSSSVASNWTASGTVQLSTSNPKYGSASILMAGSGNVTATAASSNYALPGDFTVEFWYRPTSGFGDKVLYDHGPTNTASVCFITAAGGQILLFADSAQRVTGTTVLQVGTWYHLAACRSGSTLRLFVNGVQEGSSYTTSTSFPATQPRIGSYYNGTFNAVGAFDDFRITTAARYTSSFTPPAVANSDGYGGVPLNSNSSVSYISDGTGWRTV